MFDHVRSDYRTHGRSLRNRALWAMALYRFGRWSMVLRFAPLRWATGKIYGLCTVFAPVVTGVAIDRRMTVGKGFHIVHPGMVLIHPNATFGDNCGVMHGVTVGAAMNDPAGVPRVGNRVFIGAHATLLGPIAVGDGARIAANSLVVTDVPAGALAIGVPAKVYPQVAAAPATAVAAASPITATAST